MRKMLVALAALATVITVAGTAATATTPTAKCSSGAHSDMGDMDMSGSKKCSGDENRKVVSGARTITVTGDDFTFTPDAITMKAGEDVTIALTAEDVQHDFYVKGIGHVVHAKKGKTAQGGLRIKKAGTYKFWCTVAGHKQDGMTGTITVTA
jgi:heme/copper-type cytochrome/quinol oxidase subunit 2